MGSTTTNYNFYKPDVGETGWATLVNTSTDDIDTQLKVQADATTAAAAHATTDGTSHANVVLNDAHRVSDGSGHTFIDQSVVSGASPTFDGANLTGVDAANVDIADAGAKITATDVEDALQENRTAIDLNTTHSGTTHDYSYITAADGATDVTAAELEELTDGSSTALHTHAHATTTATGSFTDGTGGHNGTTDVLTIAHSLGAQYLHVSIYDSNDQLVEPDLVTATDANNMDVALGGIEAPLVGTWNWRVSL